MGPWHIERSAFGSAVNDGFSHTGGGREREIAELVVEAANRNTHTRFTL